MKTPINDCLTSLAKLESQCEDFMRSQPIHDSAHDINHIKRVVENAKQIAVAEGADLMVVVASAWLHDCVTFPKDHPDNKMSSRLAAQCAQEFLTTVSFPSDKIPKVCHAIEAHSYSAGITAETLEAQVVQDADRLDGLGAVGVARCFTVSGKLGSPLYCHDDPFCAERQPDSKRGAVDHFYEKLFKTAEQLHTETALAMAAERVKFMREFLKQLQCEVTR